MSLAAIGVVVVVIMLWPHFRKLRVEFRPVGD
jgi:hypothetical protein